MPVTLEDIQQELARRQQPAAPPERVAPSPPAAAVVRAPRQGVTTEDVVREIGRRRTEAYRNLLPGLGEFAQLRGLLPGRADIPAPELAPPGMAEAAGALQSEEFLPTVGELGGNIVGGMTGPAAPVAIPALGAAGAAAGRAAQRALTGQPVTAGDLGREAAYSLVPEVAESVVRGVGRAALRSTPGGRVIRFDEAARRARELPETVFQPPERAVVERHFALVRASGLKIDVGDIGLHVRTLPQGKYDELASEVAGIDRRLKSGGRFLDMVQRLRQGQRGGFDIGELQTLRSELRVRRNQLETPEARQLLRDLQDVVDDTIDTGLARGRVPRGQTPELLQEARRQYARLRASEDLAQHVENTITSTPDLAMASFNMRQFYDGLRRGQTKLAQQINRSLDATPGARSRFFGELEEISQLFKTIEIPLTDVAGFRRSAIVAGVGQMLSAIMLTETGRSLFRQAVVQGRGRVAVNAVATIANIVRREVEGGGALLGP
jgi:hypothetical protein